MCNIFNDDDTLRVNDDGTVTCITPSGGEHTYDPELVFRSEDESPDYMKGMTNDEYAEWQKSLRQHFNQEDGA